MSIRSEVYREEIAVLVHERDTARRKALWRGVFIWVGIAAVSLFQALS